MKARYIGIPTGSKNTARQEERQAKGERVFIDVVSGSTPFKDRDREKN